MAIEPGDGALPLLRLLGDLPGEVRVREPLAPYTTFRIGGPALVMFFPTTVEAIIEAIYRVRREKIPYRILGGGAKVLFPDEGFPGLVIHTGKLCGLKEEGEEIWVEPGFPITGLVRRGLWFLAGIPGTAGGAVVMNAGTRYGSISSCVTEVETLLPNGSVARLPPEECQFSYRNSIFREKGLPVLGVRLRVPRERGPVEDLLAERQRTQPTGFASAGCIFRNPPGLSAGWLIDQAGLKGTRVGDAKVSEKHANFIVNLGRARARHVLSLIELIQTRVQRVFGLNLTLELEVVHP